MSLRKSLICVALVLLGAASGFAAERKVGYLAANELDVTHIVEPAPRPGDPRYETDRKIFKATRHLIGTPRWQLATSDADYGTPAMLRDFSCSVGVTLTPDNAPKLVTLIERAGADTSARTSEAKNVYQRQRPYVMTRAKSASRPPTCSTPRPTGPAMTIPRAIRPGAGPGR